MSGPPPTAGRRSHHGESIESANTLPELLDAVERIHGPECRDVVERHVADPRTLPCDVSQSHKNDADRAALSRVARASARVRRSRKAAS